MASLFLRLASILLLLQLSGCGSLFYWPEPGLRGTPDQIGITYEDVHLVSQDKTRLHGWLFPVAETEMPVGMIYFLHGNAENISTHFFALNWMTRHGWEVFILDYRGYGLSEGQPGIAGVHQDAYAGLKWALQRAEEQNLPLVMLGQSIGATTAATLMSVAPEADQLAGVVLDSPFSGYRRIAREKLAEHWLTWAFQYPLSWTISDQHSPERYIQLRPAVPLLILHSCGDQIIPCQHGQRLYQLAAEPRLYWQDEKAGHIRMLAQLNWRLELLQWLQTINPQGEKPGFMK